MVCYFQGEPGFDPSKTLKETFRQEGKDIGDFAGDEPWIPEDEREISARCEGTV